MAVSDEVIMLVLAFALNHILIMNYGVNISDLRRFLGALMTMALGAVSLVVLDINNTNADINVLGFGIFGIALLYTIIQITIVLTNSTKDID